MILITLAPFLGETKPTHPGLFETDATALNKAHSASATALLDE
jgi:hypothetical protein